ncbi:DNA-binding NtrC family response regulator [Polymorphobacter multimanifer]|uniref:DNA-binding NtrC family response regulator n=4 Tax=Polymorphobacter multimanifer TaxID=1070431 RepID=A0A841L1M8_9SPHN|nr:DNA-binding NtrC family response regulator [Polymorphobacter multimanifer]
MVAIRNEIDKVADSPASVLITGPSGSGKDVAAQLLHQKSRRAGAPYIALNCAAVAADLLESEMFGHEAGAFTGATRARTGRFEAAHTGTLFLDEVGDMPLAMQAKLLRALETRVVERVGGMIPITVEVRLISATSVDLLAAIDRGLFRSDLLYRLDVIRIEMPPLADRPQDIPLLVEHFCLTAGAPPIRFEKAAMALLMDHPWAGNVRELKNFVERTRAHHPGEVITRDALPRLLRPTGASVVGGSVVGGSATRVTETMNDVLGGTLPPMTLPQLDPGHGVDLRQLIADLEQAYIRAALSACGGTIAGSARLLGLQRTTLIEKMRRLHITPSA